MKKKDTPDMNFKLALTLAAATVTLASTASAQGLFSLEPAEGNFYVSGFVGVAFPDDIGTADLDNDVNFGGAIGGRLPFKSFGIVHTRLEAEISYFEPEVTIPGVGTGSLDNLFILANSYADFIWKEDQAIIPYFGGGLGVAVSGDFGNDTDTNFTTHNAIGITVPVNKIDLYTEGRYFRIFADGPNPDGFTLTAGLRYKF